MKLTPSENKLVELISMVGGSYCPGTSADATPQVRKLLHRLERKGVLIIEDTQDGPRFTLRETVHA